MHTPRGGQPGTLSPSLGRKWIEIRCSAMSETGEDSLPPWGGSGLKCVALYGIGLLGLSPSLGREWIEIYLPF